VGNVPVVYNPITTHGSLLFHVVHDDLFTTVNHPISSLSFTFYQSLYERAKWFYEPSIECQHDNFYTFKSLWLEPPLSKRHSPSGHVPGSKKLKKEALTHSMTIEQQITTQNHNLKQRIIPHNMKNRNQN
jgi:hypothetical protein